MVNNKPSEKQLAEAKKLVDFADFIGENAQDIAAEMKISETQMQILKSITTHPSQIAIDIVIAEPNFEKALKIASLISYNCKIAKPAAQALLDKCFNNAYYFQQTYDFAKNRYGCKEIANQAMKGWDAMWMKGIPNLRTAEQAKELAGYCRKGSEPRKLALHTAKFLLEAEKAEQN